MDVLIVDDSKFMRNIIMNILQSNNIKVIGEASNGKEAVEKYKSLRPTIVTMDLTMNEMSGVEAIKEIKKVDSKAIIIVCSAMGQKEIIKEAIKLGAQGFIIKPFDEKTLINEINKVISMYKLKDI